MKARFSPCLKRGGSVTSAQTLQKTIDRGVRLKTILIALSLIVSSTALAESTYRCTNFKGLSRVVVTLDLASQTAILESGSESHPFAISNSAFARKQAPSESSLTFEGTWLVDTGKVLIFNPDDSTDSIFTYDLLKNTQTTVGPVPWEPGH